MHSHITLHPKPLSLINPKAWLSAWGSAVGLAQPRVPIAVDSSPHKPPQLLRDTGTGSGGIFRVEGPLTVAHFASMNLLRTSPPSLGRDTPGSWALQGHCRVWTLQIHFGVGHCWGWEGHFGVGRSRDTLGTPGILWGWANPTRNCDLSAGWYRPLDQNWRHTLNNFNVGPALQRRRGGFQPTALCRVRPDNLFRHLCASERM